MFSTESAHATSLSLRSTRRRQRTNSDESIKPPKAKRQRSGLRQDTFDAPGSVQLDHRLNQATRDEPLPILDEGSLPNGNTKDLTFRGRKSEQSGDRADGTVVLSSNDHYAISRLPALPDQIRKDGSEPFRCVVSAEYGYSLALTQYRGIIWKYASSAASPAANDVLTFSIPNQSKGANDPLPLGTFVSHVGEPGLVVVIPSSGIITYWQTISGMAVVGLVRQKQNGIQGSVPGMLSGEVVTDIINTEPSGLVISFSTGRVAHVAIRDAQGKPSVSCQFLRGSMRATGGGLFGGIKSVLGGGSWRKEVAAVRAGASVQRGQKDVVIATASGVFEVWDTHWNNGNTIKTQLDLKVDILEALKDFDATIANEGERDFKILDFAIDHGSSHVSREERDANRGLSLFMLTALPHDRLPSRLFVVELSIIGDQATIGFVRSIDCYDSPPSADFSQKPRIYLPKPGNSAFILLDRAIILLSLAQVAESPSSQLFTDTSNSPPYFQDCIQFRTDQHYTILGSGLEDCDNQRKHPSCLLMVQNVGMIRISTLLPQSDITFPEPKVTIKSKLEEIVFFGSVRNNPFDFTRNKNLISQVEHLEKAALDISDEILQSSSRFIPSTTTSLEHHLQLRARALESLATYLRTHCEPLSRLARWQLLWGAERLTAQRAIWRIEGEIKGNAGNKQTHLDQVLGQMGEKYKTKIDSGKGENDRVRHWLVHDTWRMEHALPWLLNGIREFRGNISKHGRLFAEQLAQSSALSLATMETAFRFREDNASLYGLGDENIDDGVLVSGYSGLPEFWTSKRIGYVEADNLLNLELDSCIGWMQKKLPKNDIPDPETIKKVESAMPRQVRVFARMHDERCRWGAEQDDEKVKEDVSKLQDKHLENRRVQLFKLGASGQLEEAITLAEGFRDMPALVELLLEVNDRLNEKDIQDPVALEAERKKYEERIDKYFERFGESWADAYFDRQVSSGDSGSLLSVPQYQAHVTKFLRKRPRYRKISWMNDILGERDYATAAETLANLAIDQESDLWARRVELSLGKLVKIAALEKSPTTEPEDTALIQRFDDQVDLCTIQETVYEHILPCLHGAIDQRAEIQLTLEQFSATVVKGKPALQEILERGLTKLVVREAMPADQLINVLTLMEPFQFLEGDDDRVIGHEFFLALVVLRLSGYAQSDPEYHQVLEKIIWLRAMLRDDWEKINQTQQKGDEQVQLEVHGTALVRTLTELLTQEFSGSSNSPGFRQYSPAAILDSANLPEQLVSRFPLEERDRVAHDVETEMETLQHYVRKARLGDWFPTLVSSAEIAAKGQTQPEDEAGAEMEEVEMDVEMSGAANAANGDPVDAEEEAAAAGEEEEPVVQRRALRWV